MNYRSIVGLIAAVCLAVACRRPEERAAEPVARVNGVPIALEPMAPTMNPADARTAVDRAIDRHLAAEEAARRGLGKESNGAPRSAHDEERLRDALFASMRDSLALGDDDLRAHYEATKSSYVRRQWLLRREAFASEAAARAEDQRLGAAGRLDAARAESIGPTPPDALPASIAPEALSFAQPGQRAAVLRDGTWALVELEEIRTEPLPFDAVRSQVTSSLRLIRAQAAFHAELARLRSQSQIEVSEAK
ncbi:MAG TPA: peptidyl-prolyl cis-trans isomerase [Myxococcota bacterium]|nr:peptidyl-prolyl cis-trans isomerase [Myxococcota bacterium]